VAFGGSFAGKADKAAGPSGTSAAGTGSIQSDRDWSVKVRAVKDISDCPRRLPGMQGRTGVSHWRWGVGKCAAVQHIGVRGMKAHPRCQHNDGNNVQSLSQAWSVIAGNDARPA
jgi:hypothetical protein